MSEALELEGVAAGVEQKHGGLLSRLTRVADSGLEDEGDLRSPDAIGQGRKGIPLQQRPEMGHWHLNPFDLTGVLGRSNIAGRVGRDLVAEEVEVDPRVSAAPLAAAKDVAVESSGRGEIPNEESEMEWLRHAWYPRRSSSRSDYRGAPMNSGYSSLRHARGSDSSAPFGVLSSRNE